MTGYVIVTPHLVATNENDADAALIHGHFLGQSILSFIQADPSRMFHNGRFLHQWQ